MIKPIRAVTGAVVLLVALAAISVTYAYLQSKDARENPLTIAEGSVRVTETFTEPPVLSMSNAFTKAVTVKNTGTSNQYVRVYLDFSDSTIRDKSTIVYSKNSDGVSWSDFLANLPDGWQYVSGTGTELDGFFYYTEVLLPGQAAPNLIDGIKTVYGNDGNTDRITDFDIIVYTESVQTVEPGTGVDYAKADPAADPFPWKTAWSHFLTRTP